ncbi:MAG: hypothetical protein ACRD8O_21520 [Bryobacteraceae bacterium]
MSWLVIDSSWSLRTDTSDKCKNANPISYRIEPEDGLANCPPQSLAEAVPRLL